MYVSRALGRDFRLSQRVKEIVSRCLPPACEALPHDKVLVNPPPPKFSQWDYQTNAAFLAAKLAKQRPSDLAASIKSQINERSSEDLGPISSCEVSGAGFLLFELDNRWILEHCLTGGGALHPLEEAPTCPKSICVDYAGPNAGKDLHVGHLRSAAIGDTLSRMFEYYGYRVDRQSHVGDVGLALAMVVQHVYEEGIHDIHTSGQSLGALYAAARQRSNDDAEFAARCQGTLATLQHTLVEGGSNASKEVLPVWEHLRSVSANIAHELWQALWVEVEDAPESGYIEFVEDALKDLEEKGITKRLKDGAIAVEGVDTSGEVTEHILKRSSGTYLYAAIDLAALRYRLQQGYESILYVTDQAQGLHFSSVFEIARRAGWFEQSHQVEHIGFGVVQGENGKKLSSRAGLEMTLEGLLDQGVNEYQKMYEEREGHRVEHNLAEHLKLLATSAIRYYELSHSRSKPYAFSFSSAFSATGNTAISLSYVMSRLNSLRLKAMKAGCWSQVVQYYDIPRDVETWQDFRSALASSGAAVQQFCEAGDSLPSAERALLLAVVATPDAIFDALRLRTPHILTEHAYRLARTFHTFYDTAPILRADVTPVEQARRLAMCAALHETLGLCLHLLGIRTAKQLQNSATEVWELQ